MEWIAAIVQALRDLGGAGTELEILKAIEVNGYRNYTNSDTPERSLNMYLNQRLKGEVRREGNAWKLIDFNSTAGSTASLQNFINDIGNKTADSVKEIIALEEIWKNKKPEIQTRISSFIERGRIANKFKKFTGFRCQICEALGQHPFSFKKPNGNFYIETHHVEPVSTLKDGCLSVRNLITVCANHHRQIHYGCSELLNRTEEQFVFKIDQQVITVRRIPIE